MSAYASSERSRLLWYRSSCSIWLCVSARLPIASIRWNCRLGGLRGFPGYWGFVA